jgi:hypothetical protein
LLRATSGTCRSRSEADFATSGALLDSWTSKINRSSSISAFSSSMITWTPFLGGQGPAGAYVASLSDAGRATLEGRLRESLLIHERMVPSCSKRGVGPVKG